MKNIYKKSAILRILFSANNILCTITDLNGNVLFWTSTGTKKLTTSISLSLVRSLTNFVHRYEFKYLHIGVKGFNKNKKIIIKSFVQSSLIILSILDDLCLPYNGCKQIRNKRI